jgi:hypothetical protein
MNSQWVDEALETNGYGRVLAYKLVGAEIRKPSVTTRKGKEGVKAKVQSEAEGVDGAKDAAISEKGQTASKIKRYKVRSDSILVPSSLLSKSTVTSAESAASDPSPGLERIFSHKWDQTLEGQTFYHLLLLKSFVPSPALYTHVHTKHFVHPNAVASGGIPAEMQLSRVRNVARTKAYNLRYLSQARCWGPFLPISTPPEERSRRSRRRGGDVDEGGSGRRRGRRGRGGRNLLLPNIIAQALNIAPQHLDFFLAHLLRRLEGGPDEEGADEEGEEGNGEDGETAETETVGDGLEGRSSSSSAPIPVAWDIDADDAADTNTKGEGEADITAEAANSHGKTERGITSESETEDITTTTTTAPMHVDVDLTAEEEDPSPFTSVEVTISEEENGDGGATATATTTTGTPAVDGVADIDNVDDDEDEEDGATPHTHSHPTTFYITPNLAFASDLSDDDDDSDYDPNNDPDEHPTYIFPSHPHLLYPDYAFLASVRIVLEGNLRGRMEDVGDEWESDVPLLTSLGVAAAARADADMGAGEAEGVEKVVEEEENPKSLLQRLLDSLHSLEVTRMGSAPGFWGNGWSEEDFEVDDDGNIIRDTENGVLVLKRDKIRDTGHRGGANAAASGMSNNRLRGPKDSKKSWEEFDGGWDWAGVEGLWMRCVCWMDYRTLQCERSL